MILSLRLLDTGTANDVSGVIRITHGGAETDRSIEGNEYLYYVGGDGGVRVLERGQ
jgi:elongator complex protein 6